MKFKACIYKVKIRQSLELIKKFVKQELIDKVQKEEKKNTILNYEV